MISKESQSSPLLSKVREEPIEGPFDARWVDLLTQVMNAIEGQQQYLSEAVKDLFNSLQEVKAKAEQEGKKIKLIFLTRQGVPVYWLLKGVYEAKGLEMPDSDVLGISAGYRTTAVEFKPEHTEDLKSILEIEDDSVIGIFIDESLSSGRTFGACFNLIDQLGGNSDNYLRAVLFTRRSDIAPWDQPSLDEYGYYKPKSSEFFSVHMYFSPHDSVDKGVAAPPLLNERLDSQMSVYYIANQLYKIGLAAGK